MPLYEFACKCGHVIEIVRPVAQCSEPAVCHCGEPALRIISPVRGYVQGECRYDSPIDGRPISSHAQRREDLARNHCQEYDPEMKKDAARFRETKQKELEASIDTTVEKQILSMNGKQREKLGAELQSGADVTPTRASVKKSTITRIQR